MSVRKVITRSSNHIRISFPSMKNGRPVQCESQLESGFVRFLELSPLVRSYAVQPSLEVVSVGGVPKKYYPDVRVCLMDGREWWFEVKQQKSLLVAGIKLKLEAAKLHFAASGRNFSIVTDRLILRQPLADNLQKLMHHRRGPKLESSRMQEIREQLELHEPETLDELVTVFGEPDAWLLLGLGIVGIDLEVPILNDSEVFLSGGHRHADIFA
ncbi:transposase [Pseudomonas gingeri]|uniref:TnsA endonuclease N-terminal domain-containing protein n=1 Tax=Pseudomonas gingeri TaxID=117681 RepID=UPI0015A343C6|nr:TnsA endonuclease N-terminal domain-containing protein [Pseudomonas gingeri]NWD74048.1 transposase [Pseudomonas gingeri]